jgi:hypothetical protein
VKREKQRKKIIEDYFDRELVDRDCNLISFKSNIFTVNQYNKFIHEAYENKRITPKQYIELFSRGIKAMQGKLDIKFIDGVPHIKEDEW